MAWVTVLFALVAGSLAYVRLSQAPPHSSEGAMWRAVAWRLQLLGHKLMGETPQLSLGEIWQMSRTPGGFGLAGAVTGGASIVGSIHNHFTTNEDVEAGERLFSQRCASCHGAAAVGGHGPALNRSGLRHGDSDFALYRAIRDGIDGTAMVAAGLEFNERWKLVSYLRALQSKSAKRQDPHQEVKKVRAAPRQLLDARSLPENWLNHSGTQDGWRYSPLAQINAENVGRLRLLWSRQFQTDAPKFESTPIVIDGRMFVTVPPATVIALDARDGSITWRFDRKLPNTLSLCCGRVNRGVAILDDLVFFGSLDGYLTALDANTGKVRWQVKVAAHDEGYSLTGAPLIVNGRVVVGVAGGEFPTRGFVAAYDAASGEPVWKFNTIPEPGTPGSHTWKSEAWKTGGGSTWNTGVHDPGLGLIYWGVGNPTPAFSGDVRPGDNLYTNSVVALHVDSGELAWHFQFTPHDEHDWDSTQTPILTELPIAGRARKVICWPNRNGFYYVLDRTTGEFLVGTPFVELDWATGLDAKGRPVVRDDQRVSTAGRLIRPGLAGGTNWQNPAFDPKHSVVFVVASESASVFTKSAQPRRGEQSMYLGSASSIMVPLPRFVRALDAATGVRKWQYAAPESDEHPLSYSGLLSTAGTLVFGAARGHSFALHAESGKELWRTPLGGDTYAAPVTFALDGRQVVSFIAGSTLFVFGL